MRQRPLIHLITTQINHRLPFYMSPIPYPSAVVVSQDGTGRWTYAFSPVAILHLVLSKIERTVPGDFDCSSTKDHIQ